MGNCCLRMQCNTCSRNRVLSYWALFFTENLVDPSDFSDSLSKHTSKGIKERALNGLPNGDIPFGYRRVETNESDKRKVVVVPEEAEAVSQLFRMYASGGHSLASLAVWLNQQGFRTGNKRSLKTGSGEMVSGPRPFTLYSVRWLLPLS